MIRKMNLFSLCLGGIAVSSTLNVVLAAPKAPVKPKAAAKPAAAKPKPQPKPQTALGMVPMAGVEGKLNQTYTLDSDNPINFTLNSAEYTLDRVNVDENAYFPSKDEKLLVLRYTVHNPNKQERNYNWHTISFTAVDAMNQNREYEQIAGGKETGQGLNIDLKPAQKMEAYTVIKVPAKGVVPKLIVKPNVGGVIRYDLRGVARPLAAPFADPADKNGATALEEIPAQANTYYPLQYLDVKLLSTTYADTLGEIEREDNQRFFIATISIRNGSKVEQNFNWSTITPELVDADGEKPDWPQALLRSTRNEGADGTLKPGEEYRARIYFRLPKETAAKTLKLSESESHFYVFDVSNTK